MFAISSKLLSSETIFFMQAYRCDLSQLRKTSTARSLLKTLWHPINQVLSSWILCRSFCVELMPYMPNPSSIRLCHCSIAALPVPLLLFFCFAVQDKHICPIQVLVIVVELINACQLAEAYLISIILSPYAERFSTWLSRVGVSCDVVFMYTKFFRKLKLFESTPSFLSCTKVRSVLSFPFSCLLVPTFIYPSWDEFTRCYPCFMCFTCVPGIKWRSCIDYPSRGVWNSMFDQSPCDDSVICIALKSSC